MNHQAASGMPSPEASGPEPTSDSHAGGMRAERVKRTWPWLRLFVLTLLLVNAYFLLEWIFFITKPSFMSALSLNEKLMILLRSLLPPVMLSLLAVGAVGVLALAMWFSRRMSRWLLRLAALVPALILGALLFLLLDNFTYTIFRYGVISSVGVMRAVYAVVFLAFWAFGVWKILQWIERETSTAAIWTQALVVLALLAIPVIANAPQWIHAENATGNSALAKGTLKRNPNILIIGSDGLDAAQLGFYGYYRNNTSFISTLVPQSLLAVNAFANASATGGSLTALLTGRRPTATRMIFPPDILRGMDAYNHLPGILKAHGYRCMQASAPGYADAQAANMRNGFDDVTFHESQQDVVFEAIMPWIGMDSAFFVSELFDRIDSRLSHVFFLKAMRNTYLQTLAPDAEGSITDDIRVRDLMRFMDRSDQPFFIHAHLMRTHGPIFEPRTRRYSKGQIQSGPWMDDFLDDTILDFNQYIRQAVDHLRRKGKLENTIIVIYSDHGVNWMVNHRVPLLFRFPNGIYAGRINENVQLIDVVPTLLNYLGLPRFSWLDGRSLLTDQLAPDYCIFSAKGNASVQNETALKGMTGTQGSPPFYQMGLLNMVRADRWYELNLMTNQLTYGVVPDYPPGDLVVEPLSLDQAEQKLIDYLIREKYDVSSLPRPLPRTEIENRPKPEIQWYISTNVDDSRRSQLAVTILSDTVVQVKYPTIDPQQGDTLTILKNIPVTQGESLRVALEVWDQFGGDNQPGLFEHTVSLDGVEVWNHDIGSDLQSGWLPVSAEVTTTSDTLRLMVEVEAVGEPPQGWQWGKAASIGVQNLSVTPAGD